MHTPLRLDRIPAATYKLSALADKDIWLEVHDPHSSAEKDNLLPLGHQYLFVVVPFGRISAVDPLQALFVKSAWLLSERGYRAHAVREKHSGAPLIKLKLQTFSASGYDMLFARKVTCSLELQAEIQLASGLDTRSARAQGESSALRPYAFQEELEYHCEKALELALRRLFDYLHL